MNLYKNETNMSDEHVAFVETWLGMPSFNRAILLSRKWMYDESNNVSESLESSDVIDLIDLIDMPDRNTKHQEHVGATTLRLRQMHGMSQAELADRTGIFLPHISMIERGRLCLSYKTISMLALALKIPVSRLDPSYSDAGCEIERIRKRNRISILKLSQFTSIFAKRLELIECGIESPTPSELDRIADALGVRPTAIDGIA